jgi:hypothetical protein
VNVTRELAERIAGVAQLLTEDDSDTPLDQLAGLALEIIPGSAAAGVVAAEEKSNMRGGSRFAGPSAWASAHRPGNRREKPYARPRHIRP